MGLEPGQTLDGKYRIVKMIGEGGMGAVFEGLNTFINRKVAIKVLHAAAAGNEQVLRRFEREAQAAGTIGSDHILEVIDLGTLPDGDRYMVMEFLDGEELSSRIKHKGHLTPEELCPLVRQTLVGLKAAHAAQIIHRDLKPDNIFILREKAGRSDYVKIIDFGISKFNALAGDMSMTTTGAVMGTPYYMSPEQAKGSAHVDARTDLYAVGVIMYQALTGNVPFDGTSFNDLMFKIVLSEPPELSDSVPASFRAIVMKAMSRNADERYQTADEFISAIDQYLSGTSTHTEMAAAPALSNTAPGGRASDPHAHAEGLPQGGQTDGNFAHTQVGPPTPAPSGKKLPLPLVLGAAAIVLIAGTFLVVGAGDKSDTAEEASAVQAENEAEAASARAEPEESQQLEKKEAEASPPPIEEATKEPAEPAAASAPVLKTAPLPAPAPKPAPRPAAAPQPKPKPKPTPSPGGRDFGY